MLIDKNKKSPLISNWIIKSLKGKINKQKTKNLEHLRAKIKQS